MQNLEVRMEHTLPAHNISISRIYVCNTIIVIGSLLLRI